MESSTTGQHILVCDDDPALQDVFRDVLTDEGYRITTQSSVNQDEDEILRLAPDLIVLDLVFGGKPIGLEFLSWLKAKPELKAIPVLVCTASTVLDEEAKNKLMDWECAYVVKPFDLDRLLAAVAECLEKASRSIPQKS